MVSGGWAGGLAAANPLRRATFRPARGPEEGERRGRPPECPSGSDVFRCRRVQRPGDQEQHRRDRRAVRQCGSATAPACAVCRSARSRIRGEGLRGLPRGKGSSRCSHAVPLALLQLPCSAVDVVGDALFVFFMTGKRVLVIVHIDSHELASTKGAFAPINIVSSHCESKA